MRTEDLHLESETILPFAILFLLVVIVGLVLVFYSTGLEKTRRNAWLTCASVVMVLLGTALFANSIVGALTGSNESRDAREAIISDWVESHGVSISEKSADSVANHVLGQEDAPVSFHTMMDGAPVSVQVIKQQDGSYVLFYADLKALEPKPL